MRHLTLSLAISLILVNISPAFAQNVGIGTATPSTKLDVMGDLALKTTAATLTGASPNFVVNTTNTPRSYYRVASPFANFAITSLTVTPAAGLTSPDGRIVTLYNATAFAMTINHQDASAVAAERIITGTNANLNIGAGGSVTFVYNTTDNRWVVKDYNEGGTGNDWKLDGNNNAALRSIGTNDFFDFPMETAGTEKARLTTGGILAVGNTAFGMNANITGYDKIGAFSDGFGYITTHSAENATWSDYFVSTKSRGTGATPAIVANGDFVGGLWGNAYDGVNYQWMTSITSNVDGTPGAGDMPGRLAFGTSPDGGTYPVERMRITNAGNVGVNTTAPAAKLHVFDNADVNKITTYSEALNTSIGVDWESFAIAGYGRGGSTSWGYGTGVLGMASPTDAWGAIGVYARLGNATPSLNLNVGNSYNYALYSDAANLGHSAILMNGNVGIGTQNPSRAILEQHGVVGNTAAIFGGDQNGISLVSSWPGIYFNAYYNAGARTMAAGYTGNISLDPTGGRYIFSTGATAAANTLVTQTERMTILNSGNVGIGTSAPGAKLDIFDVNAGTFLVYRGRNNAATGTETQIGSVEYFHDQSSTIDFTGGSSFSINLNASASYDLQLGGAGFYGGTAGKPGGGSWANSSDARLKEDVNPFKEGLATIRNIKPVYYKYNGKANLPKNYYVGVIAQELQTVAPYMVSTYEFLQGDTPLEEAKEKIETYFQVDNSALSYITVNALKELDTKTAKIQAAFTNISDFGMQNLTDEETFIPFSSDFQQLIANNSQAVVTLTPINSTQTLTILAQNANGFTVKINGFDNTAVNINWIAMAKIKNNAFEVPTNYTEAERQAMLDKVKIVPGKINLQKEFDEAAARKNQKVANALQMKGTLDNQASLKQAEDAAAQKAKETQQNAAKKANIQPLNVIEGAMAPLGE